MQQCPKISVIIPVYKTEQFVEECVNSVLQQTFLDFEIILVNDGSPDKSGEICERVKERDKRIRVLHQENQGVTRARANGVSSAQGEWICFVDSDDTLPANALELLVSATHNHTDIVVGFLNECPYIPEKMSVEKYRENCITGRFINSAPFPKLFRRILFSNSFIFDIPRSIIKGEDMLMNIRLAFMTDKDVYLIPHKVSNYRIHAESCMQCFQPTTDYEENYHIERKKSIPKEVYKQYQPYCIQSQLQALREILKYNYNKNWSSSVFVKDLKREIQEAQYSLHWKDRIILKCKCGWVLRFKK